MLKEPFEVLAYMHLGMQPQCSGWFIVFHIRIINVELPLSRYKFEDKGANASKWQNYLRNH